MDTPEDSPEPTENKQEDLDKEVTHQAKKLLAAGAALAATATLAVTANQPNRLARPETKSAVAADVSYQKLSELGPNKPRVTLSQQNDRVISGIENVNSDNPYERAQDFLFIAQDTESTIVDRLADGLVIELHPGTALYHSLKGSEHFWPAKPSNDGEADKVVIKPGQVGYIENPRLIAIEGTVWIAATLAGDTNNLNRATDVKQVFWISLPEVEKNGQFLSSHGSNYLVAPVDVDHEGNLKFGTKKSEDLSVLSVEPQDSWVQIKNQRVLLPTFRTAGR